MKNFNAITHAHVWVLDHQQALDFYVGKLGLEVKADYDRGGFRWLTVGVPGEAVPEIVLDVPGPPVMDEKTAEQVRELVTKGATGVVMVLRTDDCFGTYERAARQGRRVHAGADRPRLRHRLRPARPVRQPDPHPAAEGLAGLAP